ncbi:Transcriptional regulator of ribosomal biogenesis proteins [Malassezia sp. CBS 17886]|nr:Transcriptional regulator of ribosomal biogenesis proteins [Malassezia sp. CBS 17886]
MTGASQGPIPISKSGESTGSRAGDVSLPARSGGSASHLGLSTSIGGSSSFKEAMAISFGKDVADLLEYSVGRFSSSTDSEATIAAPSSVRLESTFCRNFTCCGRGLDDLHDLLQHYEECHVRFEDDDVPAMLTDDDLDSASLASETSAHSATQSPLVSPAPANAAAPGDHVAETSASRRSSVSSIASGPSMVARASEDLDSPSAFDTAVMQSPTGNRGKKRAFGQPGAAPGSGANPLYRALVNGGNQRHGFGMANVYTPSSPFSTPGSSRAGTPTLDSDGEAFFGSSTQASVFSSLSIRGGATDDQLPSLKREKFNSAGTTAGTSATSASSPSTNIPPQAATDANGVENRPYKCPATGCDKAYKQMNGLKYHRLHGHCNQNLRNVSTGLGLPSVDTAESAPPAPIPAAKPEPAASAAEGDTKVNAGQQTPDLRTFGIQLTGAPPTSPVQSATVPRDGNGMHSKVHVAAAQLEKTYVCQVGNCDKRYKNLNGLRYHYLHSGSHGLLGLQLLHANGGGASAKADSVSGRPPVSTETLSREQIVQAAAAAQALLNQQAQAQCNKNNNAADSPAASSAFLASVGNGSVSLASAPRPAQ